MFINIAIHRIKNITKELQEYLILEHSPVVTISAKGHFIHTYTYIYILIHV